MADGTEVTVFSMLLGKVITSMSTVVVGTEEIFFVLDDGVILRMWHEQDCCEGASVAEVVGDIDDMVDAPILEAEAVSRKATDEELAGHDDSGTWTFYKFRTRKGSVVLRWLGVSNGYYSETVSFEPVVTKGAQ
ncbi:MAG: DUF7448 domain-containing protein [Sulfobacillus sp.]